MRRIRGTLRRIGSIIRHRWRAILRLVLWALLIGLAIRSAVSVKGWEPSATQAKVSWAAIALLVANLIFDFATGRAQRPAGRVAIVLALGAEIGVLWTSTYYRFGLVPAVVMGYLLWRFIPWSASPTPPTPPTTVPPTTPTPPTPTQAAAQAAAQAEAAALAAGASPAAAAAAAQAAAQAAATAPAPTSTPANIAEWRREAGLVTQGKWYYGRIPYTHIPLILISFKLEGESVTRRILFGVEDPEPFNNIEDLDVTPDMAWGRIRGCVTLRILPKKIGVPVNDIWSLMPNKFARAVMASWKLYKVK